MGRPKFKTRKSLEERLWSRVDRSGGPDACWPWAGANWKGHGRIKPPGGVGSPLKPHRVAWELTHGPIPNGLCICHRCDNPPCCNPSHMFLGSHQDNWDDMNNKGRHGRIKVPNEMIPEVVERYLSGETQQSIADDLGVAQTTISEIVRFKRLASNR